MTNSNNQWLSKILNKEYFEAISNPKFLELSGLVILEAHYKKNTFAHWQKIIDEHHLPEDLKKIENTINHVHMNDVVENLDLQQKIGRYLVEKWTAALKNQFPSRKFECHLSGTDDSWELEMWTQR